MSLTSPFSMIFVYIVKVNISNNFFLYVKSPLGLSFRDIGKKSVGTIPWILPIFVGARVGWYRMREYWSSATLRRDRRIK